MNAVEIITSISQLAGGKTISQLLDDCIESSGSFNQCTVNPKWFMSLKAEIESYLKGYAWKNYIAFDWVLQTNRVNITGERLEITNQTKDVVYMTVDFCSEFMPSSVLISVNY